MSDQTHILTVTTTTDDTVSIPTSRPGKTDLEVAGELAQRLRGDAALWGSCGDDSSVVIPARSIAYVEITEIRQPVVDQPADAPAEPQPATPQEPVL